MNFTIMEKLFCLLYVVFTFGGRWNFLRFFFQIDTESGEISIWTFSEIRLSALLGLLVLLVLLKHKYSFVGIRDSMDYFSRVFILSLILIFYMILTSVWMFVTPSLIYKIYELALIIVYLYITYQMCLLPVASLLLERIWSYGVLLMYLFIALSVPALISGDMATENTSSRRLAVLGGGPNIFARFVALCIIDAFYSIIIKKRFIKIFLLPLFFAALLLSGSRGGMLAALLSLIVFLFLCRILNFQRIFRSLIFFFVIVVITGIFFAMFPKLYVSVKEAFEKRIYEQTIEERYLSGREDHYGYIMAHWSENTFLGHGLGGWKYYVGINDYPHNHVLELFYEGGLLAVMMFMVLLFFVFRKIFSLNYSYLLRIHIASFLFFILLASFFSGDFFDTRYLYSFFFLVGIPNIDQE